MMNRGNQSMGMRGAQMGSGLLGNAPQNFQGNFPNNMQGLNIGNMQGNLPMSGNMQGNMMGNLQSGLMGNIQNNMENPTNDMNINNMMNMNQRNQQHMGLLGHMPHNQQGNIMQNMSNMQQLQQAGNISGIGGMGNMGNNNLNQGMMTDEMRQAMMMKNMISMSQNTNQLSQNQQQQTSVMNTALGAGNNMLTNMAGNQGLLGSQMAAMQQHGGNIQQQLNAAELQLKAQQQQQVSSAIGSSADRTTATQTGGMMTAPLMSAQELNRNAGGRTLLPTPGNAQLQQQQLSFGNSTNFSNQGFLGKQDSNQGLLGGRQDSQGLLNRQNGQGLIVDSDNQRILGRLDNQGLIGRQDNQTLIGRQDNQTLIGRQDNQTLIGRQDSGLHDRFDDHRSQFDRRQNEDHMFDRGHRDENRRIISSWDSNDDRRNRLSQDFGRYSGNSQDIKQASPEKEAQQYDPEEPTEDDMLMHPNKGALDDFNNLRTGSPISGQKRSLSSQYDDFHQSKQRREMGGESTHDIQNGNAEKFHCQLCSVSCGSVQEFDQHMHSDLHQQRMASITSLYQARTEQQIQRMKAEEVLRRVEQAGECNICQKKIRESLQEHTQGQEHIRKERLTKRGCILCKTGRFENYPSYVAHIDSDAHKQAKEILNKELAEKKKQNDYSGDHSHQQNTQDQASSEESREKTPPSNGLQHDNKVVPQEVDAEVIQGGLTYDPDTPIGQSFVIPVKGFFCRLCHKFYNNEDMAKNAHCKSLRHFEKYQEHVVSQQQESDAPKTNTKKTSFTPSAKSPDLTIKINNVQNDSDVQFQDNIDSKDTMEVDGSRALDGAGDAQRSMRRMRSEGRKHRN